MEEWKMHPIGFIHSFYSDTQQVPKGLGTKHTMEGTLEILPEFAAGLQDLEGYSHLFIIWLFHKARGYELIGTPPTDNLPHGVFSTRSPRRPNPIGLTVAELIRRKGTTLYLRGIDMLDGTPVLDVKPYTSSIPMEKLRRGWLGDAERRSESD